MQTGMILVNVFILISLEAVGLSASSGKVPSAFKKPCFLAAPGKVRFQEMVTAGNFKFRILNSGINRNL